MTVIELTPITVPSPAATEPDRTLGCPVANGLAPCSHMCGGNWPGTRVTNDNMLRGLLAGRIVPESLACGPLQAQARLWYALHSDN